MIKNTLTSCAFLIFFDALAAKIESNLIAAIESPAFAKKFIKWKSNLEKSLLRIAIENDNAGAVKILFGASANANLTDAKGETAWTLATADEIKQ